jgi:serine/threonine protein phosphatase PrpC
MTSWISFGASVVGPRHLVEGKPNQDAWLAFHNAYGDGIVISDGLGSKQRSDFGSRAACLAVARAADASPTTPQIVRDELFDCIKAHWLSLIAPLEPSECAATCVFALRLGNGFVRMGMLGDGLAAAVKRDGSVVSLYDDKSEGFSNITSAIAPNTSAADWRDVSLLEEECVAVLLCTDGVADDLVDSDGFVKGLIETHRGLATVTSDRHVREMLASWPTPKHSDDKTITCLYRE